MALACVGSSLGYAADDYCILELGAWPCVHSVYSSGKADAASIAMLPRLAEAFHASLIDQQGKSIIFIAQHASQAILRSFPLRAIVAPKIVSGFACNAEVLHRRSAAGPGSEHTLPVAGGPDAILRADERTHPQHTLLACIHRRRPQCRTSAS